MQVQVAIGGGGCCKTPQAVQFIIIFFKTKYNKMQVHVAIGGGGCCKTP